MANINRVTLIGRCTRDVEVQTFSNGGKIAKIGFAVSNSKKNQQTGAWENEPVWLDCEASNKGEFGKLADTAATYLKKGSQCYIEGHLKLDKWKDKASGQERTKLKIVVDVLQLLDGKPQQGEQTQAPATNDEFAPTQAAAQAQAALANEPPPF